MQELRPPAMPPLYVAYDPRRAEVSDVPHRNLRALFDSGDKTVLETMRKFRHLTDRGKAALLSGDWDELHKVTNENFELRRGIMNIPPENLHMVEAARAAGASAHFSGSGRRHRRHPPRWPPLPATGRFPGRDRLHRPSAIDLADMRFAPA